MPALQHPPPVRMGLFEALRYCRAGHAVRRAIWHGGITANTPEPTDTQVAEAHPLAWIRHEFGLFHYRSSEVAEHVVQNLDVTAADMRARDWTTLAPFADNDDAQNPNAELSGNANGSAAGSGSTDSNESSSTTGGNGGQGGGGSGGGSNGGSGGSGSGSGAAGGGRPKRPPKPSRVAPGVSVEVTRTSGDACVTGDGLITDSFSVNVTLGPDPFARPGELWFMTLKHGSPLGFKIAWHGTLAAGDAAGAAFSITASPGQSFTVQATAHLPHVNLNTSGGGSAVMRPKCGPPGPSPGGSGSGSGGSGGSGGGGGAGGGRGSSGSFVPPP